MDASWIGGGLSEQDVDGLDVEDDCVSVDLPVREVETLAEDQSNP